MSKETKTANDVINHLRKVKETMNIDEWTHWLSRILDGVSGNDNW